MERPRCKTCGKTEWGHTCVGHGVPLVRTQLSQTQLVPGAVVRPVAVPLPEPVVAVSVPVKAVRRVVVPKAGGFDKRAYQREYMRRRRAALKAKPV